MRCAGQEADQDTGQRAQGSTNTAQGHAAVAAEADATLKQRQPSTRSRSGSRVPARGQRTHLLLLTLCPFLQILSSFLSSSRYDMEATDIGEYLSQVQLSPAFYWPCHCCPNGRWGFYTIKRPCTGAVVWPRLSSAKVAIVDAKTDLNFCSSLLQNRYHLCHCSGHSIEFN